MFEQLYISIISAIYKLIKMLSKLAFNRRVMSTWIKERLSQVHQASQATVVGIVVDKSEVQDADFIKHLAGSKDFRQDLNMSQSYWFYT